MKKDGFPNYPRYFKWGHCRDFQCKELDDLPLDILQTLQHKNESEPSTLPRKYRVRQITLEEAEPT
jgi:hypothetical protein